MTIQTFVKKPIPVEAMQWLPRDTNSRARLLNWLNDNNIHYHHFDNDTLGLGTLESGDGLDRHRGKPEDWIIRGVVGEFYVCDREVFEMTYDSV